MSCVYHVLCVVRSIFVPERRCQSVAISEQSHALLQLYSALSVRWSQLGGDSGADNTRAAGAADCQPTSPVGSAHHVHRTHQEPTVQVLAPRVCPLRSRNWEVWTVGSFCVVLLSSTEIFYSLNSWLLHSQNYLVDFGLSSSSSSLFGMHHQCVAPLAANSLHRASSIASSKVPR